MTSLLKSLENNKPSGIPLLKTNVLKDTLRILIVEFTFLINECLVSELMSPRPGKFLFILFQVITVQYQI